MSIYAIRAARAVPAGYAMRAVVVIYFVRLECCRYSLYPSASSSRNPLYCCELYVYLYGAGDIITASSFSLLSFIPCIKDYMEVRATARQSSISRREASPLTYRMPGGIG